MLRTAPRMLAGRQRLPPRPPLPSSSTGRGPRRGSRAAGRSEHAKAAGACGLHWSPIDQWRHWTPISQWPHPHSTRLRQLRKNEELEKREKKEENDSTGPEDDVVSLPITVFSYLKTTEPKLSKRVLMVEKGKFNAILASVSKRAFGH